MTALLPANEATFSLHSHPLFPTIYQCALIPPAFVISQPGWQICSLQWCTCLSANSQKLLFFPAGCVIVASDACVGGGGREGCVWVEVGRGAKKKRKKLVSQADGNKLCSANTYRSEIQVIRVGASVRLCLRFDVCSYVFALVGRSCCICTAYKCVCVSVCVCWWKEASTALALGFFFFSSPHHLSCFSSSLFLDWWQWAEVRGQQYQFNTIHHTCQTARPAAGGTKN